MTIPVTPELLERARGLMAHGSSQTEAARELDISRRSLNVALVAAETARGGAVAPERKLAGHLPLPMGHSIAWDALWRLPEWMAP